MNEDADKTQIVTPDEKPSCPHCGAELGSAECAFCPSCGAQLQQMTELAPGSQVGKYRILKELGEGGMGKIFLVYPIDNPQQRGALKVLLKNHQSNRNVRLRFGRETRLLAQLEQSAIVKYYNSWSDQRGEYLAMEYVDGMNLEQLVYQNYEFPPEVCLDMLTTLGMAFKAAWDQLKLLHRDIKPSNIMVSNEGELKILDFGLAKSLDEEENEIQLTMEDHKIGSPGFMSPEQFRDPRSVGVPSDIFSLGATLYFVIAGIKPFDGDDPLEIFRNMTSGKPAVALTELNPAIPEGLSLLVAKMIRIDPAARQQNWGELLEDVERVRAGKKPAR